MSLYTHDRGISQAMTPFLELDLIRNACTQGNTEDEALVSRMKERILEMPWSILAIFPTSNVFIMFSSQKYAKQVLNVFASFTKVNDNFI